MRIQSTGPFQPASASSSTTRIQLAAKDNSQSSIDQKSEGCFSSLWNSFVSVLSSIWNFFTGCCKAKGKESSKEIKSKEKESSKEIVKPEVTPELLKKHLVAFTKYVYPRLEDIIKKSPQTSSIDSIWWLQDDAGKRLLSTSLARSSDNPDRHSCPEYTIDQIKKKNKTKDTKTFHFQALIVVRDSKSDPYKLYYFSDRVWLESTSNQFEQAHTFESTKPKEIKNSQEKTQYFTEHLHLGQFDEDLLKILNQAFNFEKK